MISVLAFSIGIGLAVSLLFAELFAVTAGGLVVPGYCALYLTRPLDLILTVGAALVTLGIVRGLASLLVVYGRRRTVLMILVGFVLGAATRSLLLFTVPETHALSSQQLAGVSETTMRFADLTVIGYIVPGLIAIWFDRQGVVLTLTSLLIAATIVRLLLMLVIPDQLMWFEASQGYGPITELPEAAP
jgi:poly-gamma-glutamate biosynthesis protein PgsC/CapC